MYKNSKFVIILPIVVACSILIGILSANIIGSGHNRTSSSSKFNSGGSSKLNQLLTLIDQKYVDTVNIDSLTEEIIPVLLEQLDPHSVYVTADEFAQANEALDGEFDGIGVMFNMATDTIIVLNVITGSPSEKAGVQNGDRIIKINDSIVAGRKISQDKIVKKLRGKRGSTVNVEVQRMGIKDLVPITITRGVIPIKSITAAFMIRPEIGYIKFAQFSRNSHVEMVAAIEDLKSQGMKELILDIRGNSGGFLDQAINISNEMLPAERLIVYTQDKYGKQVKQYSNGKGRLQDLPLKLLIDEGSASSSEILAGALQDNDRGELIGRRTYGKGLVQEQMMFNDGSAVRLTIARYYTPTGRSIQKPYHKGNNEEYSMDLYNRYKHNELFSADSISFADSLKFTTPGGKTVYGGGGIMPDVFVPIDTTGITPYFTEVSGRNILYRFTIEYADQNRAKLNNIKTLKELDGFFAADPNLLNKFVNYAAKQGIAPKQSEINISKAVIIAQIKAYIGRNTPLEDNAFYNGISPIDETIQRALKK